jgi:hypothetical protein
MYLLHGLMKYPQLAHFVFHAPVDTDEAYLFGTSDVDEFQTLLFSVNNLTYGEHTLTVTNLGFDNGTAGYLDVNWIDWESTLPAGSTSQIIAASSPLFELLPGPTWWQYGFDPNAYGDAQNFTQSPAARFRMNFTGEAVAVYGYLDTNHGNYSCAVDGEDLKMYSGQYSTRVYQQLICYVDGLENHREHSVVMDNVPVGANMWFSVNYAEVWGNNL